MRERFPVIKTWAERTIRVTAAAAALGAGVAGASGHVGETKAQITEPQTNVLQLPGSPFENPNYLRIVPVTEENAGGPELAFFRNIVRNGTFESFRAVRGPGGTIELAPTFWNKKAGSAPELSGYSRDPRKAYSGKGSVYSDRVITEKFGPCTGEAGGYESDLYPFDPTKVYTLKVMVKADYIIGNGIAVGNMSVKAYSPSRGEVGWVAVAVFRPGDEGEYRQLNIEMGPGKQFAPPADARQMRITLSVGGGSADPCPAKGTEIARVYHDSVQILQGLEIVLPPLP